MENQFDSESFDLIKAQKVRIPNHHFGHNKQGQLDVWIEHHPAGERFSSQIIVQGQTYPVRQGVYTTKCYILREKLTGSYWFLDRNPCGFWLQTGSFFGAKTFSGSASVKIQNWLTTAL